MLRLCAEEGILPTQAETLTWGEAVLFLRARREGERRRQQCAALIAWEQAGLIARAVLEGSLGEVYECFPFWTEEEVRALRVEKCRALLERMAACRRSSGVSSGKASSAAPPEGGDGGKGAWK